VNLIVGMSFCEVFPCYIPRLSCNLTFGEAVLPRVAFIVLLVQRFLSLQKRLQVYKAAS
jgi:hypothetical protein